MRATVVGSGPNGLAAAVTLASAGVEVHVIEAAPRLGGGTRSSELTLPGLIHDECSALHPLATDTPFSRLAQLDRHGLQWGRAEVEYAHPLDDGAGAAAFGSVDETAAGLGRDATAWTRVVGGLADDLPTVLDEVLRPALHVPHAPVSLAAYGARAALTSGALARLFHDEPAKGLWAGVAAHGLRPFSSPMSAAVGIMLAAAAHRYGWPMAHGGSEGIARAMLSALAERGGTWETGRTVHSLDELDPAGPDHLVLLDTAPGAAARIVGDRLPRRVDRALRRYRHGPGTFKLELAVDGAIPWTYEPARRAAMVHVGGSAAEVARAEALVCSGRMPERPFVLVGQQYLADPTRSRGSLHPVYAYAHVPAGWPGDAQAAIEDQIERFAPGFRDRVVARHVRDVAGTVAHNANYVGGDVVTGANTPRQLVARPRLARDPYWLGTPGVYLCSAATPPGGGAHGMCGFNAAGAALRRHSPERSRQLEVLS